MAGKPTIKTIRRSSATGRLVTKSYADKHPSTTETERVKVPAPKRGK
jgi:hypothetical protein